MNTVAFTSAGYLNPTDDGFGSSSKVWRCDTCGCLVLSGDMDLHRKSHDE